MLGFPQRNFAPGSPSNARSPARLTHSIPAFVPLQAHFAFPKEIAVGSSACSHRQRFRNGNRLVDPDFVGKDRWFRSASDEALRVTLVSNIEHFLALPQNVFCLAIVHHRRREQAQAGVAMFLVVPAKKSLTESSAILNAPETVRELRPILQGAELAFRVRIIVRDVRPTMR